MTAEEIAQARKKSSIVVYNSILHKGPMTSTIIQYKTYLELWKAFCDGGYDGDLNVEAGRMLEFVTTVVFTRKVKHFVNPDTGYSGDQGSDDEGNSDDEAAIEGEGFSETCRKEAESLIDELETNFITTVTGKTQVIQNAQTDELGRKIIWTPVSYETTENPKALVYLWKHQNAWTAPYSNPAPNPRKDIKLREAFENYGVSLVYDITSSRTTRKDTCAIRDLYGEKMFIRMSSFTWRMLPVIQLPKKRPYNGCRRFPYI
ncbi:hypothetical protein BGZ51_007530 [Haplosporangium sp. Z 767]|nr:hypothetical protein BGZ51_007530 [Haplosporangium sp. Z 767]